MKRVIAAVVAVLALGFGLGGCKAAMPPTPAQHVHATPHVLVPGARA